MPRLPKLPKARIVWLDPFEGSCCSVPKNLRRMSCYTKEGKFIVLKWLVDLPPNYPRPFFTYKCVICGKYWFLPLVKEFEGKFFTLKRIGNHSDKAIIEEVVA